MRFDNNVILPGSGGNDDFSVWEACSAFSLDQNKGTVSVSADGVTWFSLGDTTVDGGANDFDIEGTGLSFVKYVKIVGAGTPVEPGADGMDLDSIEALTSLSVDDIEKAFADNPRDGGFMDEIDVRVKGETDAAHQQFKAFTITITNNTGVDNAFTGLIFFDAVPAEYDLDPEGEDRADASDDNVCDDSDCNGIAEDANGKCTVTADIPNGAKPGHGGDKGRSKLEPELLSIDASGLLDGDNCTTTVYVMTDLGDHKKMYTPTSCPVDLNSGVKVFDVTRNLLLQDDDQLVFVTTPNAENPLEGTCNDVEEEEG